MQSITANESVTTYILMRTSETLYTKMQQHSHLL